MINGAHILISSTNGDADRAFLKDILGLPHVDVGDGWLIFGLPPSEVAVHPGKNDEHELFFMCENMGAFADTLKAKGIECAPAADQGWGVVSSFLLPGGGKINVYEPRHPRPHVMGAAPRSVARAKAKAKPKPRTRPTAKGKPTPKAKGKAKARPKAKPAKRKPSRRR